MLIGCCYFVHPKEDVLALKVSFPLVVAFYKPELLQWPIRIQLGFNWDSIRMFYIHKSM